MAVWTGLVRDARIDRDKGETVLFADGVDVQRDIRAIDRKVDSVTGEVKPEPFGRFHVEAKPTYTTERTYADTLVPTGRAFVVRYPRANEAIVAMHAVTAFGRYDGRASDGRPVLKALVVFERDTKEHTTTSGD
jgi:hypothetical protein